MAFQDDDSKTLDGSVVVHDLTIDHIDSITSFEVTRSIPNAQSTSKLSPTPVSIPKSKRHSTKKNIAHDRNRSLGTLVPARYLTHAPSLIKLLDAQRHASSKNLDIPANKLPLQISKSAPDPKNDGSPTVESENDFNANTSEIVSNGGHLYDSQGDIVTVPFITDGDDSVPLQEPVLNAIESAKQEEYVQLLHANSNAQNKDEMVDMQMLAVKAAEEFRVLANDNDRLQRDNDRMKAKYDDIIQDRELLTRQLNDLKDNQQTSNKIVDELNIMQSKSAKWELEKNLLIEQLREYKQHKVQNGTKDSAESPTSDVLVGKTGIKLRNRQSADAERLMMESLAAITKEKNALEHVMYKEKDTRREYEVLISNLKKELSEVQTERERLNASLDKQQQLYFSLRENAKKKELEIDNIVGLAHHESLQEEVEAEKEKFELLEAVDEQKAYIEELEAENQRLMATKVKDDDRMFNELKAIRVHRFQPSMNFNVDTVPLFNAPSDAGTHSRAQSQSFSNYSQSGLFFANISNGDILSKTARTQINMFGVEDFPALQDEAEGANDAKEEADMDTPQPTERNLKVGFKIIEPAKVDPNKKKKMEEMRKLNAEIEFFLLTCFAVKANLVEEYPDKPDVITEDAMKLFETAQKDMVVMSKFNLWIELKLREKYNLPKLEGFQKFMDDYDVKGKMSKIGNKVGQASKSLAKSVETRIRGLSKKERNDNAQENGEDDETTDVALNSDEQKENWGQVIRRKTGEFGTRMRGLSNAKKNERAFNDNDDDDVNATVDEKKSIATDTKESDTYYVKGEEDNMATIEENKQDTNDDDDEKENKTDNAKNQLCSNCSCVVM